MQKKLIALAVAGLVSGGAFAQSNVTISGTYDTAIVSQTTSYQGVGSRTQRNMQASRQGTSAINFTGTEDLGGGMKANFKFSGEFNSDQPANWAGSGESWVGLSSGMGSVMLGTINTTTLTTQAMRSPFGTKNGSGYGAEYGTAHTRNADSVMYVSPSFSGFNFTVGHTMGASTDATAGVAQTADQNEIGLKYANGPLAVAYTRWTTGIAAAGSSDHKQNNLGASYSFGAVKLMGGWGSEKNQGPAATTLDSNNWNIGADWAATSNINVMANWNKYDDKLVANNDRRSWALGLKYTLSKRTSAYVRYVDQDTDNAAAAATTGVTTTLLGVSHNF